MKPPTPIFSKRSRSRLGLSGAVVALILVVIGIAITLIVGSITGGILGGWARKEGIVIDRAEANLVGPAGSQQVCVLVAVKNIGSSPVTALSATTQPVAITLSGFPTTGLAPGQTGTANGCTQPGNTGGLARGDMISIQVLGNIPGGNVGDRRGVPVT
jgi:hypothetical protein